MIIEVRDLRWAVRGQGRWPARAPPFEVLRGANLAVERGEVVGLAGPSGAGKTILGLAALRLLPAVRGRITWDRDDVTRWPERRLRPARRKFQALLQSPQAMLSPFATVREHLEETLRHVARIRRPRRRDWQGLVDELDLGEVLTSRAHELSGGEARRVGLARVLLCRPVLLFADEPDAGLDPPRRVALVPRSRLRRHLPRPDATRPDLAIGRPDCSLDRFDGRGLRQRGNS